MRFVLYRDRSRYDKTSTKSVMKKLIRLEILKCWTLLFISVTYQVNVYFLGRQQRFEDVQTLRKVRNYANLYNNILKLYEGC